ncbi:MAG: DNA/RNA non-specific endonuclease, partial [Gammaproteobacteria bacterium]
MPKILLLLCLFIAFPAEAANYRIGQCLFGCPAGPGEGRHLILRPIYALSYNTETKVADWVSYKVS